MLKDRTITEAMQARAEEEIIAKERIVDYDTKEYTVELIVQKFSDGREYDENELFIPDYQRELTWDVKRQSKFIESVLIGLPIPFIFVADIGEANGRLEIVDGSQRIRTLADFVSDVLVLSDLEKLPLLNGFRFSDLPLSRKRRFNRRTLRMIELTQKADEEVRRDIFERINSGSDNLKHMEIRRGVMDGPLIDLIEECAAMPLCKQLLPLSAASERRRDREELVLRFFAYLDNYQSFDRSVKEFVDNYVKRTQPEFDDTIKEAMKSEFDRVLDFAGKYYPNGFTKEGFKRTPRIRFEALAIGTALALREEPNLVPANIDWMDSDTFMALTTSDASNSRPKLVGRVEYVRDVLLGRPVDEEKIEKAIGISRGRSRRKR